MYSGFERRPMFGEEIQAFGLDILRTYEGFETSFGSCQHPGSSELKEMSESEMQASL